MLPQRLVEIETALKQTEPARDPRVKQALHALKLLTAEVRSQNLDFRLLRCLCATAYRLMELDFKRIESYLTLVWLFSLSRVFAGLADFVTCRAGGSQSPCNSSWF
jgi:hypothetical protein